MKYLLTFSTIVEVDYDLTRNEAFDAADQLAERIREKSGIILEVYDVDPVEEY